MTSFVGASRTRGVRLAAAVAVAAIGVPLCFAQPAGAEGAGNPNNYKLSATANSVDVVLTEPGAPLIQTYQASPYGAAASLNSLGGSFADAGAPYSPLVNSVPGLVNGLGSGGQLPPLPPLPGYVTANYPSKPIGKQAQAGYEIAAASDEYAAKGVVKLGAAAAGSNTSTFFAAAEAKANDDGSVDVAATAGVDLLNLGGLVDIGNISSTASMHKQADQTPEITGSTNLGTVKLLGTKTGLVNGALSVFDVGVPVPLTTALLPVLNTALKPAGIKLTYVPVTYVYTDGTTSTDKPEKGKTILSVDSGALQVHIERDVPTQGLVTADITLGRVMLSATNVAGVLPSTDTPVDDGTSSDSTDDGFTDTGDTGTGTDGSLITDGGSTDIPIDLDTSDIPMPTTDSPSSIPFTSDGGQPSQGEQQLLALPVAYNKGPGVEGSYLMLMLAGLAAVAGALMVKFLAIRLAFSPAPPTR